MLLLCRRNDVYMHDSTLYDSADDMLPGKLRRALFFRCSESVGVLNQQHGDKALGRGKPNLKKHTNRELDHIKDQMLLDTQVRPAHREAFTLMFHGLILPMNPLMTNANYAINQK